MTLRLDYANAVLSLQYRYGFCICLLPLADCSRIGDEEGRKGWPLLHHESWNDVSWTI